MRKALNFVRSFLNLFLASDRSYFKTFNIYFIIEDIYSISQTLITTKNCDYFQTAPRSDVTNDISVVNEVSPKTSTSSLDDVQSITSSRYSLHR